jgi:hypothetical protein
VNVKIWGDHAHSARCRYDDDPESPELSSQPHGRQDHDDGDACAGPRNQAEQTDDADVEQGNGRHHPRLEQLEAR